MRWPESIERKIHYLNNIAHVHFRVCISFSIADSSTSLLYMLMLCCCFSCIGSWNVLSPSCHLPPWTTYNVALQKLWRWADMKTWSIIQYNVRSKRESRSMMLSSFDGHKKVGTAIINIYSRFWRRTRPRYSWFSRYKTCFWIWTSQPNGSTLTSLFWRLALAAIHEKKCTLKRFGVVPLRHAVIRTHAGGHATRAEGLSIKYQVYSMEGTRTRDAGCRHLRCLRRLPSTMSHPWQVQHTQ